jgi:hypothetical protein
MKTTARFTTLIAHGAVVATILGIAIFAFPIVSDRYEGVMGRLPEEYRAFQVFAHLLRANGLLVVAGFCIFLWVDYRYIARIQKEEIRTLISAGYVIVLCAFIAWFVYAATSPDRFIQKFRSADAQQIENEK